ncbi:BCCT family transporter [Bacillus sp. IB182487]|uniref:BCCT family transporter n=1 Tax=Metabacillus arenae TaxID=2771434 RepID=A0A926NJ73_9BACI|nr:BCCT family transporter [Metabacillus arenae]
MLLKKNIVFNVSLVISLLFIAFGIFSPERLGNIAAMLLEGIAEYMGWYYLAAVFFFLVVCIYAAFSKYGSIRLGKETDRPKYSTASWIAMLYSAGIAISILFWGVAEPVYTYTSPPFGQGGTAEAAETAMKYAFFHWGFHLWGTYAAVGLILAYFQYRKNRPALLSSTLYPLIGERVNGPIGKTIDIMTILASVFGVTTSLGLGTMQITGGLHSLWGIPNTVPVQIGIVVTLTVLFLISALSGLDRGIKYLSNINIILALTIMTMLFVLGPTAEILRTFVGTTGRYLDDFLYLSFRLESFRDNSWISGWTIFYWGWLIAWAPFVGLFIARISQGRTIKEFIIGALIVPSVGSLFWFSVFGGSALHLIHNLGETALANAVTSNIEAALFAYYQYFPLSSVISVMTVVLLFTFFITSADSATFVLGMFSEQGNLNPSNKTKLIWGIIMATVAIVLLVSGGLKPLQSVSVTVALPFSVVIVLMCFSFFKELRQEVVQAKVKTDAEFKIPQSKSI